MFIPILFPAQKQGVPASNSTIFRWAWPPQLPLQVHLNLCKVHLVLILLISHLEQINDISSPECSYLKGCENFLLHMTEELLEAFQNQKRKSAWIKAV